MHYRSFLSGCYLNLISFISLSQASSILFTGATIIAFDEARDDLNVIRNGSLLVKDDRIAGIWPAKSELSSVPRDTKIIDATGKIITPGFIDTHRHGWHTLFKTLMSNTTIAEYFGRFSEFASAGRLNADQVYISQLAGLYEALNAGVTTTLDHAHHTFSDDTSYAGLNASIESGARVIWAYAFHNVTNYTVSEQLVNFRDIAKAAKFNGTNVDLGIACDFFGGVDAVVQDVEAVFDLAREYNVSVLTAHTLGGPYGFSNGPRELHTFKMLNTSIPVVLSHSSFLTFEEAALMRSSNQFISINAESEMHAGVTHPQSTYIMDHAALGMDTHAWFSTDMVTQARLWLQSTRVKRYNQVLETWHVPATNPMSVVQAFRLITRSGGLALRRPDLGVLSVGAKADLVVFDGTSPGMLGWTDPVAAVILHSNVGDMEHVLVNGHFIKRDFKLVAKDYLKIKSRFLETARWAQETWHSIPYPPREEIYVSGAPFEDTLQIDATPGNGSGYGEVYQYR
ncbi:hypothetical protein NW765_016334 [Fusarium oxysporum]|nr:hypothetical protein NW765_016334 [Fusarium oxysporum]KAJ4265243.1 hypothetical protein NW764_015654 [Fusarium oxysporum]